MAGSAGKTMNFLRYVSRPRIVFVVEIHIVAIMIAVFLCVYLAFLFAGVPTFINIIVSFLASFFSKYVIEEAEEKMEMPGFWYHFFYAAGIYTIDLDSKKMHEKYPELDRMKHQIYIPKGFECEFFN